MNDKYPNCDCIAVCDEQYIENQLQHMDIPHQWFDNAIYKTMTPDDIISVLYNK